jgi:hypothetical protein
MQLNVPLYTMYLIAYGRIEYAAPAATSSGFLPRLCESLGKREG